MTWNNGRERRKFDEEQKRLEAEQRAAGMTEEKIEMMHQFDLMVFNNTRNFYEHTQQFPELPTNIEEEDGYSPLFSKFCTKLSTEINTYEFQDRYWWIEDLDTPELAKRVKLLPAEDIELITLLAYEGYSQQEIAQLFGVNQSTISRRLDTNKNFLRNFSKHA